jgi:hypothetical protein
MGAQKVLEANKLAAICRSVGNVLIHLAEDDDKRRNNGEEHMQRGHNNIITSHPHCC